MTKTAEVPQTPKVLVECRGIVTKQGFNAYPPRSAAVYVSFEPGKPTEVDKSVADYLVAQDAHKFVIVEPKKGKKDAA